VDLPGRVAIVTGAGMGLGEGIARRLGREGCSIVVADLDEAAAVATTRTILDDGGTATPIRADVGAVADVEAMVALAESAFGALDVVVNNAGGANHVGFPDAPAAQWETTIKVNLVGTMRTIQAALPALGRRQGGAIVNIASLAGVGNAAHPNPEYAAAKAGVVRLTTALAGLADQGVRVNCICPDWIDTPASRLTRELMTADELMTVPPVLLTPDDIAGVVVMFITDERLAGQVIEYWCGQAPRLLR
jgi:3-oxoacyl-[acyl-carrier protein] reductase